MSENSPLPGLQAGLDGLAGSDLRTGLQRIGLNFLTAILARRRQIIITLREAEDMPELRPLIAQVPLQQRRTLAAYLARHTAQCGLRSFVPSLAAQAFLGMLFAYAVEQPLLDGELEAAVPLEDVVKVFVEIFLGGIQALEKDRLAVDRRHIHAIDVNDPHPPRLSMFNKILTCPKSQMTQTSPTPNPLWRAMRRLNGRIVRNYRRGIGPARVVLLLTTTGRRSGLPRLTPLQYEMLDGDYYIGSARGDQADWFRNLQAACHVEVEVKGQRFSAQAEAVTDAGRIADFLALRLERHPWMIGLLMRLEGLPWRYTRADLERFAAGKALAILHPTPPVG